MSSSSRSQPRRSAQSVLLKPSRLDDYIACHKEVWPEVLKQIRDCNIIDYSIHLDDTLRPHPADANGEKYFTLYATIKYVGSDWEGDMRTMRENKKVREWWEMTDSMQVSLVEGSRGSTDERGWWREIKEVFRCD